MSTIDGLRYIADNLARAIVELQNAPEKSDIAELVDACKRVDAYYEAWCEDNDFQRGHEPGTTYRDGISLEFYIEAEDWHQISLALRAINAPATP